jgi:hypothetical protein
MCIEECQKRHTAGVVCDTKGETKWSVVTEERVWDIQTQSEISPQILLRYLPQETDVSLGSAFTGTRQTRLLPQ